MLDARDLHVAGAVAACEELRRFLRPTGTPPWLAEAPFALAQALRARGLDRGYRWAPTTEAAVHAAARRAR